MKLTQFRDSIDWPLVLEELGIELVMEEDDEFLCHCPNLLGNHKNGDSNPSFGFNKEKLAYNCFVCGGGHITRLVSDIRGCTQKEAEQWLIGYAAKRDADKDELKAYLIEAIKPPVKSDSIPRLPISAIRQYRKIHPYLYERGISRDVIIDMQVGYSEDHDGIIIPHFYMGNLVGYQVRHLSQDDAGKYTCNICSEFKSYVPKYINTGSFPKQETLYNYDNVLDESEIIVVESPMTALYLMSNGIPNVVATFGDFNQPHGLLLARFPVVKIWPDNDKAGMNNVKDAMKSLAAYSRLYVVPVVPGEKSDAANLRPQELEKYIKNAYPIIVFKRIGLALLDDLADANV